MPNPLTKQTIPIGLNQPSHRDDTAHGPWANWRRHVDSGRIGNNPSADPERAERHARNERILRGERALGVW